MKNNPKKDFDATKPAMVGPTNQSMLLTTRKIPKPSERFDSGSRSARMALWAGLDTPPMKPISTESGYIIKRLPVSASKMLLIPPNARPSMINIRRPNLSVQVPPNHLPIKSPNEYTPSNTPAVVMPTWNFWVMYKEKNGNTMVNPRKSIELAPMMSQNCPGYSL